MADKEIKISSELLISGDDLTKLTGKTDQRHRQLAKENYFPPPSDGWYRLEPTVRGMCEYLQLKAKKKNETVEELKEENLRKKNVLLQQQTEEGEIRLKETKGEYKSVSEFAESAYQLGTEIKSTLQFQLLDQLPVLNAGCDGSKQRENNEQVFYSILKRFQEWAKGWGA